MRKEKKKPGSPKLPYRLHEETRAEIQEGFLEEVGGKQG